MELKEAMLEEYNSESEKRGTIRVTTQLSIDKSKNMLAERERQLEDAQLAYCRLAGIDVGKRGIGYIPWYREEYRNLAARQGGGSPAEAAGAGRTAGERVYERFRGGD
ncbi:MAG: hypothetical protein ACLR8P_01295 [Clostridium fessum]